jgi:hypothetical protein
MTARMITVAAALTLAFVSIAPAQQDDRTREIAVQGPSGIWNQSYSSGTRTDLAPKFDVPVGTTFTTNPLYRDEGQPEPNVIRAWLPSDVNPGQCPYTPAEQQRMSEAISIGQSGLGGLLAPTAAAAMQQVNEESDARCGGRGGQ